MGQGEVHLTEYAGVVKREATGGTAWLRGNGACPGHVYGTPRTRLYRYVLGGGVVCLLAWRMPPVRAQPAGDPPVPSRRARSRHGSHGLVFAEGPLNGR